MAKKQKKTRKMSSKKLLEKFLKAKTKEDAEHGYNKPLSRRVAKLFDQFSRAAEREHGKK